MLKVQSNQIKLVHVNKHLCMEMTASIISWPHIIIFYKTERWFHAIWILLSCGIMSITMYCLKNEMPLEGLHTKQERFKKKKKPLTASTFPCNCNCWTPTLFFIGSFTSFEAQLVSHVRAHIHFTGDFMLAECYFAVTLHLSFVYFKYIVYRYRSLFIFWFSYFMNKTGSPVLHHVWTDGL